MLRGKRDKKEGEEGREEKTFDKSKKCEDRRLGERKRGKTWGRKRQGI